jgi:hypothetical protein
MTARWPAVKAPREIHNLVNILWTNAGRSALDGDEAEV